MLVQVRDVPAAEALGQPGVVLERVGVAPQLAHRLGQRLALLLGEEPGQLVFVRADEFDGLVQDFAPTGRGQRRPGRQALFGRGHGAVDVFDRPFGDAVHHLARRGIADLNPLTAV